MPISVTPSPGLHPVGTAFAFLATIIWPIYIYLLSSYKAFRGGIVVQLPFKVMAVALLLTLLSQVEQQLHFGQTCAEYAQFKLFALIIFGYLVIMSMLIAFKVRDRVGHLLRRSAWPAPIRWIDGGFAVFLQLISVPWLLEAVAEVFQLPPSTIVSFGLKISGSIVATVLGHFATNWLGYGKSFVETGGETLNSVIGGTPIHTVCTSDGGQGKWIFYTGLAILLIPAAIVISFDSLQARTLAHLRFRVDIDDEDFWPVANESPIGVFAGAIARSFGWFVIWMILDFLIFVVRIASGVW